jgi:ATP-dependent DNA helicase PIF1
MKRSADATQPDQGEGLVNKRVKTVSIIDLSSGDAAAEEEDAAALEREIEEIINGPAPKAQGAPPTEPPLSASQQRALDMVKQGHNVFITGNAGSGKSFLIARIIREMAALRRRAVVTASTGVAAWNTRGVTVHSFSGLGWADKPLKYYTDGLKYKPDKRKDWEEVDVLIIDEVSMLSVQFMEMLDEMARFARQSYLPFGGVQLVLTGDYFQCPSVEKYDDDDECDKPRFPFQSPLWAKARIQSIALKENFRQRGDRQFFELLERVKVGECSAEDRELMQQRLLTNHPDVVETELIKLCSRRAAAHAINMEALYNIKGEAHKFVGVTTRYKANGEPYTPSKPGESGDKGKTESYPVDVQLTLKAGAEVLLCVNMKDLDLHNGSRGRVLDFRRDPLAARGDQQTLYPYVEFAANGARLLVTPHRWDQCKKGKLVESFTQVPLILCYAITIHKAQGLTLPRVRVTMDFFEHGQGYVALSRVRELADLYLLNVDMDTIKASPAVIEFYKQNNLL